MEEKVLNLLSSVCEDDIVLRERDINLFEEDLLDSLAFTELLVELEEQLGVVIAPSEIEKEDINTPNKIIAIVESKL
ncbi:MAG: D-alanine--poly(phosphoribitol) ligase subunit DltC [Anaerovoracaceae bacterium]|nr:D-alanine--poly(phosphoribitol) ligase subunit DltC [Anaerovoracaceae bacterium]